MACIFLIPYHLFLNGHKTGVNMNVSTDTADDTVWFVYDGACPICNIAANGLAIQKAVGVLNLLDARANPDHPILQEINSRRIDLDESMAIKFGEKFYQGPDALQIMALLGTNHGWFNRMNYLLFRNRAFAKLG